MWQCGWPAGQVRTATGRNVSLAVIGDCGADDEHLDSGLAAVTNQDWPSLTKWPGSYLVVARTGATLAVIGDLSTQHPVYWCSAESGLWWSTSAIALASMKSLPVDRVSLAARLACAQPEVLGSRSLFEGVHRVPSGHLLLVNPDRASTIRYEPSKYPVHSVQDAASKVRVSLEDAVDARLDGRPVSADLAGLDSTTLVCLAARRNPVHAVTFANRRLRDDDEYYATRTARAVGSVRHTLVEGGPSAVYYHACCIDLESLPLTDAPHAYVVTASIKRAVLGAVAVPGGVHFTGSAGDGVLATGSAYLADLVRTRRYGLALRHMLGHARLRSRSPWRVLRQHWPAAHGDLRRAWHACARDLRSPPRPWEPQAARPVSWTPLLATADWMGRRARADLADAFDEAAEGLTDSPPSLADWSDRQHLVDIAGDIAGWRELALHDHGVELAAPFLDNGVIRACLTVPAEQRGSPDQYKRLLTNAFSGAEIVPDFVLNRHTKGGFDGVSYGGLVSHAEGLRRLLGSSSCLADLGLLTPGHVTDTLGRAVTGLPLAAGALHLVTAAEVWLRQLDTAQSWWERMPHAAPAG
nr:albusnodin/ikarugamycin family macrolactam cyclase [Actinoalloteichus spitiensis]